MPDDSRGQDAEIILSAYAETLREAFRVFAENVGMGQNPKNCQERFTRSLDLLRKSRDLALEAVNGLAFVEPIKEEHEEGGKSVNLDISAEDQEMIDKMLDRTTGAKPVQQPLHRRY